MIPCPESVESTGAACCRFETKERFHRISAEVLIFAGNLTGGGSFADIRGIRGEFAVRMRATGFRYRFFGILSHLIINR